jgi:hypothetical protein
MGAQRVAILCSMKGFSREAHFSYKRCQKKAMLITAAPILCQQNNNNNNNNQAF